MKITHVLWSLRYGGAETMLVDIVNRQCLGHDVEVLLINDNVDDSLLKQINPEIKITRINRPLKSRNIYYLLKLNLLILFSRSDVIHCQQDNIIRYVPVYPLKRNLCLTVHDVKMDVNDVKKYNCVFAISDAVKSAVKEKTGIDPVLIHNGIDVRKFNTVKRKPDLDIFRTVQVGRLNHLHKGQHITLNVISQLITRYNYPKIHLDIIGGGESEKYLKQLADELNINPYVTFMGNRTKDYIRENLSGYDLLIQPSLWEGFGLTVTEAMSALTPTLVSNVDGMKTASQNGELSYTFKSGNVEDCTEKLYRIIHAPAAEKEALAKKAYDYVLNNFDISFTADNYLNSYKHMITH